MALVYVTEQLMREDDVSTLPLVDGYLCPLLLCGLYVCFVKGAGPLLMENRKPFELRTLMVVYNAIVAITYAVAVVTISYGLWILDSENRFCHETDPSKDYYPFLAYSMWIVYLLKYVEFADTVFFILRKKFHLISALHVIHHAVVPILTLALMRNEKKTIILLPSLLNSIVHIIMYTYYCLAAMGPRVAKYLWWKKYLTLFQIVQFVLVIGYFNKTIIMDDCQLSNYFIYQMMLGFYVLMLVLFSSYYVQAYKKSQKKIT